MTRLAPHLAYLVLLALLTAKQATLVTLLGVTQGPWFLLVVPAAAAVATLWARRLADRRQLVALALADLAISLLVLTDRLHFKAYGDFSSISGLAYASQLATVADGVGALFESHESLLFVDVALLLALCAAPASWRAAVAVTRPRAEVTRATLGCALFVLVIGLTDPTRGAQHLGHQYLAKRLGALTYHVVEAASWSLRHWARAPVTDAEVLATRGELVRRSTTRGTRGPLFGAARGRNVIVLQVESLQRFALGARVLGQDVTPTLSRLAAESLDFEEFYEETGVATTADADFLANCALLPLPDGAVYYQYGDGAFRCLPRVLREAGYGTYAFQGIGPGFWNLFAVYPRVGFERYFSARDFHTQRAIGLGLDDAEVLKETAARLATLPEPFEAFVVTITSHTPFEAIPKRLELGDLAGERAGKYLNALRYTDDAIGEFVAALGRAGVLDRSVLVVYGDHAAIGLGRGPAMQRLTGVAEGDEAGWRLVERRVPLLVRLPGGAAARKIREIAGEVDLMPTVLGLVGIEEDLPLGVGRDVLRTGGPAGLAAFHDGAALDTAHVHLPAGLRGDARCVDRPTGKAVSLTECADLAARAEVDRALSKALVERNLLARLRPPADFEPVPQRRVSLAGP